MLMDGLNARLLVSIPNDVWERVYEFLTVSDRFYLGFSCKRLFKVMWRRDSPEDTLGEWLYKVSKSHDFSISLNL